MNDDSYNAREAMGKLNLATTTFYRKVKEGHIPYRGQRPKMRFPKEAIDAIVEIQMKERPGDTFLFKLSTVSDEWDKFEIRKKLYGEKDAFPFRTVLIWRQVNEEISMQLNKGNKILGWSAFLPLEEGIILEVLEGRMRVEDIPAQAVKKWEDSQISVFIPSIEVVPSSNTKRDTEVTALLIRNTIKWAVSLMAQHDIKNWYSIGTSSESQAILEALGFKQINSLDNGKRKGYKLADPGKPSRLQKYFLRSSKE